MRDRYVLNARRAGAAQVVEEDHGAGLGRHERRLRPVLHICADHRHSAQWGAQGCGAEIGGQPDVFTCVRAHVTVFIPLAGEHAPAVRATDQPERSGPASTSRRPS